MFSLFTSVAGGLVMMEVPWVGWMIALFPLAGVWHEAGHGIAVSLSSYRIDAVFFTATRMGVAWSRPSGDVDAADLVVIAAAGPAANLAAGLGTIVAAYTLQTSSGVAAASAGFGAANLILAVVNLVPCRSRLDNTASPGGKSDGQQIRLAIATRNQATSDGHH